MVTTTFPQHSGDSQPRFVLNLCQSIPGNYEQRVLAPSARGCATDEMMDGIRVRRFRYFLNRFENLAYGSGILGNLKANPLRWLLVPFFLCGLLIAIRRELRQFDPDIVHTHWWFPAGLVAKLAIASTNRDSRLLVTCHGADYYVLGERLPALRRWVFKHADAVTVVSPAMKKHAAAQSLPTEKISVAPMGAHLADQFTSDANSVRRGVLYVGRLVEKKGVDILLRGWANASATVRAQGLTIIGSGLQRDALRSLAERLGISDSVTFHGSIAHDKLPEFYQAAALLVFPSTISSDNDQEGLGLVAIEAMGCSCPVLASDISSLEDIIIESETGFVSPMGDTESLARRLDELLAAPELCGQVAERGRDAVLSRFDWVVVGNNYRLLYDALLKSNGPVQKTQ